MGIITWEITIFLKHSHCRGMKIAIFRVCSVTVTHFSAAVLVWTFLCFFFIWIQLFIASPLEFLSIISSMFKPTRALLSTESIKFYLKATLRFVILFSGSFTSRRLTSFPILLSSRFTSSPLFRGFSSSPFYGGGFFGGIPYFCRTFTTCGTGTSWCYLKCPFYFLLLLSRSIKGNSLQHLFYQST